MTLMNRPARTVCETGDQVSFTINNEVCTSTSFSLACVPQTITFTMALLNGFNICCCCVECLTTSKLEERKVCLVKKHFTADGHTESGAVIKQTPEPLFCFITTSGQMSLEGSNVRHYPAFCVSHLCSRTCICSCT